MCKLNIVVLVISLFGLFGGSVANILQSGQCDTINVYRDFNITLFAGTWIEIQRTGTAGSDCSTVDVTLGTTVSFNNTAVNNNFYQETTGTVTDNNGTLTLTIAGTTTSTVEINALLVNYDVFALMYSCENVGVTNRMVTIYLIQREGATPTEMMYELMTSTLNSNFGLSLNNLRTIDHSEAACYQLPVITAGQPIVLPGLCDSNITAVPDFQVVDFLGLWHEIGSYFSESALGTCSRAEYSLGDGVVDVVNSEVINQTLFTISGNASVVSADGSGHLQVLLNIAPGTSDVEVVNSEVTNEGLGTISGNASVVSTDSSSHLRVLFDIAPGVVGEQDLWIINTDYNSFAVSYSCVDLPATNQRRVFSWILSRAPQLTSVTQELITQTLRSFLDLNENYYVDAARSDDDCFYFPEPDGTPVVFRGQCNESIPVMPNFDPAQYLGIWHNIESYPSQFIFGSCVNAEYSLREDGAVDVLNSQVIGERLFTINGIAEVPDASEAAKLNVTFPIEGTNETISSGYWVLDTDYTTYSLVYTCINLPNNERSVTSWKLGRAKSLNSTVLTLMDEIIDTIPVLDNRYYQQENQSVDGCFYYPDPVPGQVVLFPGQCEDIDTVQNFNLTAFAGTWYELEAYPKDQQGGQCISHEYELSGTNQLSLQSTQIVDQFLVNTTGVVTPDSTNSARLTINITSGSEQISIPFWIISTDYENYALAYSCVNRNEDFRAVYSWKLGRSYTLSDSANANIQAAMAPVDVLNQAYFETIDQSLDACFYLPDLAPGEPVVLVGQCETDIPRVQNFLPGAYTGTWRLLRSYPAEFQTGTCHDATYTILDDGTVEVFNTQVVNQTLDTITGSAVIGTTDGSGLLLVTFPGSPVQSEYWILDTDYTSYSLVYSCVNLNERERRIFSWVLSRNETLSEEATNSINAVINNVTVLNNRYFEDIDRTAEGCFYFPEPNGNPVRFRGQCDQNITVVQNFNATGYLGLWHTIASYPSPSQLGTCNNADYSLGDGVVNVFNTEVRNQTLSTINGIAYIDENEPAKLLVQFPGVTNATSDYWVLATDYNSYSLVYSCVDIDEEHRLVYSWKLSRTKALSAADISAINTATSNVQVLDDRYFVESDQSPEGCFYFPDAIQGTPVVFPGQCNSSIPAVSDFNITRFEGRWHEIESYPTDVADGECTNHIISAATGNTWNVASNSVNGLSLNSSTAVLSVASTTEPGKLTITVTSTTGVVRTLPFWVLDTDYETYALVYSCVDNDDDARNVYSWKLSRSRTLPTEVATLIDNTIDTVDVLRSDYYWPVDQTDDACFYLPDLQPGEPAIFPGQCDPDISVVPNFDAARYLGRWRLISSYPSAFQDGTCNEADYSLGDDGSVIVYNTQVVDQTLDSITGSAQIIGNGKLLVTFPDAPVPIEYWVLDTDYDTYTLIYSCLNINDEQRQVWSWKMSRGNTLNETTLQTIDTIIESINVLDDRYFYTIDRSEDDCFYFPDVTNQTLIFRGQCNESIPVVQEFNAAAYQGLWYDIESYPQEFQFGGCPTAQYTINDQGVVDVYNTQVFQQRLDTINGTAVLASDDGSAKLDVTFPFPGFELTTPYWVLDTDYEDYALVYSCVNINEDYYRVGSWKLSRSQSLSTTATSNINAVMSNIRVLDQRYYLPWAHSEEACFYYPPLTDGRVVLDGQCEDETASVVANFNVAGFAGSWYEIERFPSELQSGECTANRFEQTSATEFTLTKSIIYNERQETFTGPATLASDGSGVLTAILTNGNGSTINLNLYVLDTDYDNYALLYSCRNYDGNRKQIFSWKLSKNQEGLTDAANQVIDGIITENNDLFEDYYQVTSQDNDACFYYPEFTELPEAIELPGLCDERIVAVPDFDFDAYHGRWIETARYPHPNQLGACSRTEFFYDSSNSRAVENSEVIDQLLIVDAGSAMLASNDGSGIIETLTTVNGEATSTRLYVLATDYTSYSLVYTCTNQPNGNRIVHSWKLSRDRTLSAEASNQIDQVIADTQGLTNEYFVPISQTDEDCFYIPEVSENAPLFRQQCASISGQENFDIQRFVGWWHEIESYPRDVNAGDCISSNYQTLGNQVRVVDTGIFDVTAQQTTGTVQADSNGRLLRFLNNGTASFTQDVWVLATDYETYALLYSCENVGDEYRRVWSAKYSKSRLTEYPQAAQTVMDNIIGDNQVLYSQFYQPTDQSDSACFHYPEQTGQQIILPGQCDDDITVEQNFNAVEYTGRWYQIERYPQIHESGNCTGAKYSLDEETGVVTLLNWEVIDGELDTIEGTAVITSTDGSAKLMVSLPVNGTEVMIETPLYVLTTDYVTYSLAYSCVNIDSYYRAVAAWKLSRTRAMPASGTAAINAYMATREEIHQPYFIEVGQSEDCEEPNSSAFIRSSIIVTIICLAIKMLV